MKKLSCILLLALATFLLVSCFDSSISRTDNVARTVESNVNYYEAKDFVFDRVHRLVKTVEFADSIADEYLEPVPKELQQNDFAVEVSFYLDGSAKDYYQTLASTGTDGNGDAWILLLDERVPVFLWREEGSWLRVETYDFVSNKVWHTVKVEHVDSLITIFIDGYTRAAATYDFHFQNVEGSFTVGFDKAKQGDLHKLHGKIAYASVETVEKLPQTEKANSKLLAAFEFNDVKNPGKDFTLRGNDAKPSVGSVEIADSVAVFDGTSGLTVPLTRDFKTNDFVIETRFKVESDTGYQTIVNAEPLSLFGEGWQLSLERGVLCFRTLQSDRSWSVNRGRNVNVGEWVDVRVAVTNNRVNVFQNEVLTISQTIMNDFSMIANDLSIGFDYYHGFYFNGLIDYIRYYWI